MKKFAVTLTILLVILGNYGLPIFSLVVQADDSISFTTEIIEDAQTHEQSVRITGIEGNVEPSDHTLVIPEQIIVGETTYDVTEIGKQAFIDKHLTNVTFLGEKLRKIWNYAFADNQLTSLTLPDSLKEIGEYAFRDNELEHLALTHVTTLGKQAFANNKLKTIQLGEVTTIGDEVFTNNQLTTVEIGNTVTSFGTGVFGFNDRFVEVKTTNPLIQNEVVPNNGYGHVVNPVTVTVEFLKPDGTKLTEDQTIGSDFYDYNGVIMLGKENTYKPQAMLGYMPEQSEIKYTPDSTNYVLKVRYIEAKNPEITASKPLSIRADETISATDLKTYFKATDYTGKDISDRLNYNPTTLSALGKQKNDTISVTVTVTDDYEKTTSKEFKFVVTPSLKEFVIGKIDPDGPDTPENQWTLGDFSYSYDYSKKGYNVSGFAWGDEITAKRNKLRELDGRGQLILPHINPQNGAKVVGVYSKAFGNEDIDFGIRIAKIDDYDDNIISVDYNAFKDYKLLNFTPDMLSSLKKVGEGAFGLDASATELRHNSIEEINTIPTYDYNITFRGSSFVFNADNSSTTLNVNLPNLKIFRNDIVTYRKRDNWFRFDSSQILNRRLIKINPSTFSNVEKLIVDNHAIDYGIMKETTINNQPVVTMQIPDELIMNRLQEISTNIFEGVSNPNRLDQRVVIRTTTPNLPSGAHYIINPPETDTTQYQFTEADFVFDTVDTKRVLGFTENGLIKLNSLNANASIDESQKVLKFPERVEIIAKHAFSGISAPNIRKIIGPNIKKIEDGGIQGLFYAKRLDLDFPKVEVLGEKAITFNRLGEIDQFNFPNLVDLYHRNFANMRFLNLIALPKLKHMYQSRNSNLIKNKEGGSFYHSYFASPIESFTFPSLELIEGLQFISGERVGHNDNYFYAKEMNFPSLKMIDLSEYYKNNEPGNMYDQSQDDVNYNVTYFGGKIEKINLSKYFEGVETGSKGWREANFVYFVVPDAENEKGTIILAKNKSVDDRLPSINDNLPIYPTYSDYAPDPEKFPKIDVNPRRVVVKYVDATGQEISPSTERYLRRFYGTDDSDVYPKIIKGYYPVAGVEKIILGDGSSRPDKSFTVDNETQKYEMTRPTEYSSNLHQDTKLSIAQSTVIYTYQPDQPLETTGVEMTLSNEKRIVDGEEQVVDSYLIGNVMLSSVKLDTTLVNLDNATIYLNYDPKYVENVKIATYGTVESYDVNESTGVVTIKLGKINASTSIEIPVQWRFKRFVTPKNYQLEINAQARGKPSTEQQVKKLAIAGPIYLKGTYDQPTMQKMSPQNMPDYDYGDTTEADNGIRYFGEHEAIKKPNGELINRIKKTVPVEFSYRVLYLDRNIGKSIVTDTLPKYKQVKDDGTVVEATAVFNPAENPGWTLLDDGQTVRFELNDTEEVEHSSPTKVYKMISKDTLPKLYLHFPQLQLDTNVKNTAEIELIPEDALANEPSMLVNDDITIYQSVISKSLPIGEIHYLKDNNRRPWSYFEYAYFYDILKDRQKVLPFVVELAAKNKTITFNNATITDYGIDERLYYSGIEVSNDDSLQKRPSFIRDVNSDSNLASVVVRAYGDSGSATMNPKNDPVLQQVTLPMNKGESIVFDPRIAKEIKYIQIIFPKDYVVTNHLLRFNINTKLRNPEQSQFDADPLSNRNVYINESLLSGDALSKADGSPVSSHNNSFSTIHKPYQSIWDNIEGNYLLHDRAGILIRQYSPNVGINKTQTTNVPAGMIATPGTKVDYVLSLHPKIGDNEYDSSQDMGYMLKEFKMIDLVPVGLNIRNVSLPAQFAKLKNAKYEIIDNYEGIGRQAIVITADEVPFGLINVANISAEIDIAVPNIQTLTNEAYLTYQNNGTNVNGETEDIEMKGFIAKPVENDPNTWLKASSSLELIKNREVIAKKYIRNVNRTAGTFGPWLTNVIETPFVENDNRMGADFEYRLVISNDTQDSKKNLSLVDILPFANDKSIQELNFNTGAREDRGSKFHNYLDITRSITVTKGSTSLLPVDASQYSITYDNASPYSYDYENVTDIEPLLNQINWQSTPTENAKAIKITGTEELTLNPGERIEVIIPMKAPSTGDSSQEVHSGDIAYNSFIRKDDSTLRYIEANKVGNHLSITKNLEFTKYLKEGLHGSIVPADSTKQAVFEIRSISGDVRQIAKSDETGKVKFTNLPVENDYQITEISAPDGYERNKQSMFIAYSRFGGSGEGYHDVSLTPSEEASWQNFKDYTGSVHVYKKDASEHPLRGIRFRIYGVLEAKTEDGMPKIYDNAITTNEEGYAGLDSLPEGRYTITEITSEEETDFDQPSGFPASFTISSDAQIRNLNKLPGISNDGQNFTYQLINNKAHIILQKLGVTQEADLDSLASLTDVDKEKLEGYEFDLTDQSGHTIASGATNKDGFVTVSNLDINKVYKITEKRTAISDSSLESSTNKGYKYNEKVYFFRVNAVGKLEEVADFTGNHAREFMQNKVNFPNLKKKFTGEIEVVKKDQENRPLPGVIFGLYQNDKLIRSAATKMNTANTKASIVFDNLLPGTYVLRELKAPIGFVAAENGHVVVIPENSQLASTTDNVTITNEPEIIRYHYTASFINYKIKAKVYKGDLLLTSVPYSTALRAKEQQEDLIIQELPNDLANVYKPLAGIEFKLYEQEGNSWNYLETYTSDANGEIDLTSYPFDGTKIYRLIESKSIPNYRLDETPLYINFPELSKDRNFNGEINLYKANNRILGRIIISKYGEPSPYMEEFDSDLVLSGILFELYDTEGNLLKTAWTDGNGIAMFDQLENGEYIIKEPYTEELESKGYAPNTTEYHVTIDGDTKLVRVVYRNERPERTNIVASKRWIGNTITLKNIYDFSTREVNIDSINFLYVYVLAPAISDSGELVYMYTNNNLYLSSYSNWQGSLSLPIIKDPYHRGYKLTEYSQFTSDLNSTDNYAYAETTMIGGEEKAIFRDENRNLHRIEVNGGMIVNQKNDFVIEDSPQNFTIYNINQDLVSVGDYVFIDKNNNHLQDADEKGLAGVKVTITNADGSDPTYYNNEGTQVTAPYTTTTNEQGYYRFINLNPGEYKIHFELTPEQVNRGYVLVDKGDGTNSTIDSNANPDGWTDTFNLQPNANKTANPMGDYLDNPTIDAGVRESTPLVSLGDYVFIDTNGNHLQDSTDQPLAGVSVQVLKADGSNPEWFNGTDFVTDPYITTTDATGHYQFTNLKPDTYKVQFTLTEAQSKLYAYVSQNVGDNDALDSDAVADNVNPSIGLTEAKAVSDLTIPQDTANAPNPLGLNNPTFDAGVTLRVDQLVSLGDKVFVDMDNNNTQTEGDLPLANMKVKVVNADGTSPTYAQNGRLVTQEYTTTTDEQGYYHFDQLVPGNYKVIFELTPEQQQIYRFVTPDVGGNDALDSDAKVVNPAISYVAETSAQEVQPTTSPPDSPTAPNPLGLTNPNFDAGVRLDAEQLVSLGDYVFIDVDGSQTQTASDQPLPNVSVEVRTADGQLPTYLKNGQLVTDVYTTTTDLNGRYQFNNLLPGSYKVYFTLNEEQKSKYQFIAPNVGGDKTKDSDATVIDPLRPERAVTAADVVNNDLTIRNRADNPFHLDNPDFDAGVAPINQLVSVGDKVFIDRDGSNTQTPGDRPLPNVTVSIVKVNPDGTTTDPTYMKNGELITAPYTTKTDQDGLYSFVDLVPGDYQVIFTLSDAQKPYYHYVTPEVGGAPSLDSDAHVDNENSAIGRSKVIHLVADPFVRNGENNPLHLDNPTIDAGVVGPDYELPGAGKMELWFWYLASMSMLLIGLALFFGNRKHQLVAIQTMPVSTMTSKGFTNIRQDETQSDIMEMENQVAGTTESLRHSTDQVRPSEEIVSDMPNVDAIGETVEKRLHRLEKIVDSGEKKASTADVEVDDPPPERPPQNKHPSSGPFSST